MLLCIQIWSDLFILELERQKEQIFSFWNIQFCNWMTLKNYDKYNKTCFPSVYYYIFTFHFSTIFRFDSWWTDDSLEAMFQISSLQDVRNPIKDIPIHHLQVGSLEDRGSWRTFWRLIMMYRSHVSNLKSLGCQEPHQRHPYPPSPGWIPGGQGFLTHLLEVDNDV